MKNKILITGGAGFIGSHITDAAIEAGMEAVVIDNLFTGKKENVNPKAKFYLADIRHTDISDIFTAEKPDIVCHHAAQVSVRNSVEDPAQDAGINIVGSINVIDNCRKFGVKKIVFASSGGAIYGEQEKFPAPEDHPARPESPYGAAKLSVEHYLYIYKKVFGLEYVALRYSNVYGPRQDPFGEAGVVAIFTAKMLSGNTPLINGDGGQTRDYVYVKDVVQANMLAFQDGAEGPYNVGTGMETDVNRLYELIRENTGYRGGNEHGAAKAGEQYRSVLDSARIKNELGWKQRYSLEEGLKDTVEYFRRKTL
ncbi:MAG: NAD-dependent epimerase/dehydratase family protein [Nitrospirota bacterium]